MRNFTKTINVSSVAVSISAVLISLCFVGVSYVGITASNEATALKKQLSESQMQKVGEASGYQEKLNALTAELDTLKAEAETQQATTVALATCQRDLEVAKTLPKKKIAEAK